MQILHFPLYRIMNPTQLDIKDGVVYHRGRVLDDRNLCHKTLAERRLHLLRSAGMELAPLKTSVYHYGELIKVTGGPASGKNTYIDRYGKIIKYEKTAFKTAITRKIAEVVHPLKGKEIYIRREGESIFIEVPKAPNPVCDIYAIAAIYQGGLLFLGYSEYPIKDTRIKL